MAELRHDVRSCSCHQQRGKSFGFGIADSDVQGCFPHVSNGIDVGAVLGEESGSTVITAPKVDMQRRIPAGIGALQRNAARFIVGGKQNVGHGTEQIIE